MAIPNRNYDLSRNHNHLLSFLSPGSIITKFLTAKIVFFTLNIHSATPWVLPPGATAPLAPLAMPLPFFV
jgi:hypothetical protein